MSKFPIQKRYVFYVGQLSCVVDIGSVVFMIVSSVPWRFSSVFLSRIILFSPLGGQGFPWDTKALQQKAHLFSNLQFIWEPVLHTHDSFSIV